MDEVERQPRGELSSSVADDNDAFTIRCGEGRYKVRKALLQEKSPYFEALFASNMRESVSNEVEFGADVVDGDALETVLAYVESSVYPQFEAIDKDFLFDVLSVAHLFLMTDFFEHCSQFVADSLDAGNLLEALHFSKLYKNDVLTNQIMTFVARHCGKVKDTVLPHIDYDHLLRFVDNTRQLSTPSSFILDFLIDWVKLNVDERRNQIPPLLKLAQLETLTKHDVECFLRRETLFTESQLLTDCLLESYTLSRLKVLFFTGKKIHVYFTRTDEWLTMDFPKFYEPFWNGTIRGTEIIVFTGNLKYNSVLCNAMTYDWKTETFQKRRINPIEISAENSAIALLNDKTYLLQIKDVDDVLYESTVFLYDSTKNGGALEQNKIVTPYKPSCLVAVGESLYLFDKRAKHFGAFHKYDVVTQQWSIVPYPEPDEDNYEEKAVCCNKALVLLRYGKVKATLFWDHNEPRPDSTLRDMERRGSLQMRNLQSGVKYVAFSVEKTLFTYHPERKEWTKAETTGGPEEIMAVLNVPEGVHWRVPSIYVVGCDGWLHALTPDNDCQWTPLTDLRVIHYLHDFRSLLMLIGF